jgi:hypothetical protein
LAATNATDDLPYFFCGEFSGTCSAFLLNYPPTDIQLVLGIGGGVTKSAAQKKDDRKCSHELFSPTIRLMPTSFSSGNLLARRKPNG